MDATGQARFGGMESGGTGEIEKRGMKACRKAAPNVIPNGRRGPEGPGETGFPCSPGNSVCGRAKPGGRQALDGRVPASAAMSKPESRALWENTPGRAPFHGLL